jgi:hypothetical protein
MLIMRLFIDGDEVTIEELNERLKTLDCGDFDGGAFEVIVLDHISAAGDMYFETDRYNTFA